MTDYAASNPLAAAAIDARMELADATGEAAARPHETTRKDS